MAEVIRIPFKSGFGTVVDILILVLAVILILYTINSLYLTVPLPEGVDLIRERPGKKSFSWKTRFAYIHDCEAIFHEAYYNYTKRGKAIIVPGIGWRTEIFLPASSMRWALSQPENVLGNTAAFVEMDQLHYSLGHTRYVADAWQASLVRDEMNSVLENIVEAMNEELKCAFDKRFGTDEENWTTIDLIPTVQLLVAQAASRFTVGMPLCRNEEYLRDALATVDGFVINGGLTYGTPAILRPLVGRIAGLKARTNQKKVTKHFEPTYRARLETLKYSKDDPAHTEPVDHLQLMLRFAQRERPHELYDLEIMSRRLTAANLGSMHLTSFQVTNMILNILGSDPEFNTISVLRDEISQVLGDETRWSKAHIAQMVNTDSLARETSRCHSFGSRAILRKVLADGVVTDTGVKLPKGSLISFLGQPAQVDEENYQEPMKFDPFRFSRGTAESANGSAQTKRQTFVTTTPNHLPFGHGKHSCPGRFLVDFELKMITAYLVQNYDLKWPGEYGGERPANKWLLEVSMPPSGVRVMVKRRRNEGE